MNYIFGTEQYSYSYGNGITEANQTPSIADGTLYEAVAGYMPNARPLSSQATDLIHGVGLYGSVGIEWFVAPKIALGANVNIALYYMINPSRTTIYEGLNTMSIQKETFTETIAPASHGVSFATRILVQTSISASILATNRFGWYCIGVLFLKRCAQHSWASLFVEMLKLFLVGWCVGKTGYGFGRNFLGFCLYGTLSFGFFRYAFGK